MRNIRRTIKTILFFPRNLIISFYFYLRHVWNTFGYKMSMQHDAYLCETYKGANSWPTQRLIQPNNFVASVVKENVTLLEICPVECRRHIEWEYC